MDAAGLSARQATDRLGHAKVPVAQGNHFGRKVARTAAADAVLVRLLTRGSAPPTGLEPVTLRNKIHYFGRRPSTGVTCCELRRSPRTPSVLGRRLRNSAAGKWG
jgi:hypothetical protein